MANPEKGEVSFEYQGKEYTLVLNTMALAKLQAAFTTKETVTQTVHEGNRPVTRQVTRDVIADLEEIDRLIKARSLVHIVALFWATAQKYHAAEIPTRDAAGEFIDQAGASVVAALMEVSGLGKVDPKDLEELAKVARGNPPTAQVPRKRRKGGVSSISTHVPAA